MLADADRIEQDAARYSELIAVLPHLEIAVKQRGQIAESQRTLDGLTEKRRVGLERLDTCEQGMVQAGQKRTALQKTITTGEQRQARFTGATASS